MKQKLHDLMLKILPFEGFRQNDVCEYDEVEWQVLSNEYNNKVLIVCDVTDDDAFQENAKDLKLISRDWQLPDLLMVMNKINTFVFYEFDQYAEGNINTMCFTVHITMDKDVEIKFDLTKGILEQESIKEIINIITGE